jgi:hypothetical protein
LERVAAADALRLLEINAATGFITAPSGRIERQSDPDRSQAPRMVLAGCEAGNIVRLRADVSAEVAAKITAVVAREPPFDKLGAVPRFLEKYRELLSIEANVPDSAFGQIHLLAHDMKVAHEASLVRQGSAKGAKLFATLGRHGVPKSLKDAGFADISHFWEPWCVAMQGDEIAAIAFAARLGETGAELGVTTMPEFRGRRFAAAVTACWTSLPQLKDKTLFYSTTRDNLASQRVIAQLGLPFIGVSVRLV